jgi:hypothetical protein
LFQGKGFIAKMTLLLNKECRMNKPAVKIWFSGAFILDAGHNAKSSAVDHV